MIHRLQISLITAILWCSFTTLNASVITFSDTEFTTPWSVTTPSNGQLGGDLSARTNGSGGSAEFSYSTIDGNPGGHARLRLQINPSSRIVEAFYAAPGAIFSPQLQGEIQSLSFQFDTRKSYPVPTGNAQAYGPALMQNGFTYQIYYADAIETWQTKTNAALTATNFFPYYGYGLATNHSNYHPNFSSSGSAIQLGYYRGNSTVWSGADITGDLDNWNASIDYIAIPEPATTSLLLIGFGALFVTRRIRP